MNFGCRLLQSWSCRIFFLFPIWFREAAHQGVEIQGYLYDMIPIWFISAHFSFRCRIVWQKYISYPISVLFLIFNSILQDSSRVQVPLAQVRQACEAVMQDSSCQLTLQRSQQPRLQGMEPGSSSAAPGSVPPRPREPIHHARKVFDKMLRRASSAVIFWQKILQYRSFQACSFFHLTSLTNWNYTNCWLFLRQSKILKVFRQSNA